MAENSDEILFLDESPDDPKINIDSSSASPWKILIVDDEKDVHVITKIIFKNFIFQGRSIEFLSAYNSNEAKEIVKNNPDISLILLDVVMEKDNSGLEFVKYLRDDLKNKLIRIIIRTGHPGQAPEKKVIIDYDINDYKEKTELTEQKFFTAMVMALRSYRDLLEIENYNNEIKKLLIATNRFVPHHFLHALNKKNILEVVLGEYIKLDISVFFLDIRSFTVISENLQPDEMFTFINLILGKIEPELIKFGSFIDKYMGDSIMALFLEKKEAAILAAISIFKILEEFNQTLIASGKPKINIGISINSGLVVLGTIGYYDRMDFTAIGSVVNTAAKLEKMNKEFGTKLLITEDLFNQCTDKTQFNIRNLGNLIITGKSLPVKIIEVLNVDSEEVRNLKIKTQDIFEQAINSYTHNDFELSLKHFQEVYKINPKDTVAEYFVRKCKAILLIE